MNTNTRKNDNNKSMKIDVREEFSQMNIKTLSGHDIHIVFHRDGSIGIVNYLGKLHPMIVKTSGSVRVIDFDAKVRTETISDSDAEQRDNREVRE